MAARSAWTTTPSQCGESVRLLEIVADRLALLLRERLGHVGILAQLGKPGDQHFGARFLVAVHPGAASSSRFLPAAVSTARPGSNRSLSANHLQNRWQSGRTSSF